MHVKLDSKTFLKILFNK